MKKEEFKAVLTELLELKKIEQEIRVSLKKLDKDFNDFSFGRYETLVVKTLTLAMNDEKSEWIAYWIYDLNCGKDAKKDSVKDKNGKSIPIKTINDLYKLLNENKV